MKIFSTFIKIFSVVFAIFLVSFFSYLYLKDYGFFMTKEEKFFYKKLEEFKKSQKNLILLQNLTNFKWDEACFVAPYETIANKDLDFKEIKFDKEFPNSNDEGIAELVFINRLEKSGKVFIINRIKDNAIEYNESTCFKNDSMTLSKSNKRLTITKF